MGKNLAFTHLHLHTEYSLLDGAIRIKDLSKRLKELDMTSCAITDHGVMYGVVDFYSALVSEGIKPIIGAEIYIAPEGRFNKEKGQSFGHLILLAENNDGLKNLNRIVSTGFVDGFYYKPRVDYEILRKYSSGIIALSSCLSGEVPKALLLGDKEKAKQKATLYQEIFGKENYFLEVQANGMPEQNRVNKQLRALSEEMHIPLVATNDCHYMLDEDATSHEVLLCMQTGKRMRDDDRMRMGADSFYLKSEDQMRENLPDFIDAIENTQKIAERCNVELDFSTIHLPAFEAPNGKSSDEYIRELALEGLEERLELPHSHDTDIYMERFEKEIQVISSMGFTDYYLIVWDFIRFARKREIMVGPGRGSGAGSLIAYALGITNIDPLEYNLLFERFLNVDRVSLPDFDIDFCYERRQEVIDYVYEKYGADKVSQVITFGTLAARAAVRDVGRALDLPYAETDKLSKMIPTELGITLDLALEKNPELKTLYENDENIRRVYDLARKFEGMPRHASTHAAGVIISSENITDIAPLARNDESIVVQYAKENVERLGLLKFDFLGLRTLTVLRDTRDMVKANYGESIAFDKIPLDDEKVYQMISSGDTAAVFQLESQGMTAFIKELKPDSFEDIIAGIALYRPGPMEQIPRYVAARHNPELISYHHPMLEEILDVTYGTIVYQEQVMQIVRNLGGFSLGQADIVRRAMSKKKPELLAAYEEQFIFGGVDDKGNPIDGCIKRGVEEKVGRVIFHELLAFAGYAFNKSHAAAYALVAYYTAWLKFYYPMELMAAMLNSYLGDLGQAANYIHVCQLMHISVLGPDVNFSFPRFTTEDGAIRFALGAVKNVGEKQISLLVEERENHGKFADYGDFLRRSYAIGISRKVIESLIFASALDGFGISRARLISALDPYYDMLAQSNKNSMDGQVSFFDLGEEKAMEVKEPTYLDVEEYGRQELLAKEKEMLGIYLTGHPLEDYARRLNSKLFFKSSELNPPVQTDLTEEIEIFKEVQDQEAINMAGMVLRRRNITTKRNELMSFLLMEDLHGQFECVIFPKTLAEFNDFIREGRVLALRGRVSTKEDFPNSMIINEVDLLPLDEEMWQNEALYGGIAATNSLRSQRNAYTELSSKAKDTKPFKSTDFITENLNTQTIETHEDLHLNAIEITMRDQDMASVVINIPWKEEEELPQNLLALCKFWHGDTSVLLFNESQNAFRKLEDSYRVEVNPYFLQELVERYGINNIWIGNIES